MSPGGSSRTRSSTSVHAASRSRSSRRRRSVTSGSRTATGSSAICARARGSCCSCRSFLWNFRRAVPRDASSSTRTGSRPARWPRRSARRSSCRCGGRTSSWRGARRGSRGGSSGGRGWSSRRRRSSPTQARALGARDVRVVPSGVTSRRRWASRTSRRTCSTSAGCRPRRASLELVEACRGLPLVVVGDGPLRDVFRARWASSPPAELGPYYERGGGRRRAVAAGGLRHGRARGDGRAVQSSRRAVGGLADAVEDGVTGLARPPGDVAALRRRSSGCSATRICARGSGRRAGAGVVPSTRQTDALLAVYDDVSAAAT